MTWRSKFCIHSVIHLILQSQVKKRPPRLRPRRDLLRWLIASSGIKAMGFPSKAKRVRSLVSLKAVVGMTLIRLNPRSKTCNEEWEYYMLWFDEFFENFATSKNSSNCIRLNPKSKTCMEEWEKPSTMSHNSWDVALCSTLVHWYESYKTPYGIHVCIYLCLS